MTTPTDTVKVADTRISDREWADATNAHERFKALLETNLRAKARSDTLLSTLKRFVTATEAKYASSSPIPTAAQSNYSYETKDENAIIHS